MRCTALTLLVLITQTIYAAPSTEKSIEDLQSLTQKLQQQIKQLQKKINNAPIDLPAVETKKEQPVSSPNKKEKIYHSSALSVHTLDKPPPSRGLYPTALISDERVVTYIAGTPVVTSPYTGDRQAFDGSDYLVNISSINRDLRLMQQRRKFYRAYEKIGYPVPNIPIIAISGKAEPVASYNRSYSNKRSNDLTLGSSELDVAAIVNRYVEAFMSIAYDESPPVVGPRVSNSSFDLKLGFVNIGNLDKTPFYFTAGQLYAPYGRYSSAMISSPLTMLLGRTKTRPFILGYKSQQVSGPYAAVYGFISETTLGHSDIGGVNLGYSFFNPVASGDIGVGVIGSITDSQGMQSTGSAPLTTFGGFASPTNGNEAVEEVPGLDIHANISIDRYSFTAEWVGASKAFKPQYLSYNGRGAKPKAAQLEAGVTFISFTKPSSFALGYQWSQETLALNLPKNRISGLYSISIWKDTVESLEYRHDRDYGTKSFANGASAPGRTNDNTMGTGRSANTLIAQVGVYF